MFQGKMRAILAVVVSVSVIANQSQAGLNLGVLRAANRIGAKRAAPPSQANPNTPPMISGITNQEIPKNGAATVAFQVADAETPASELKVAAVSDNQAVVPNEGLVLSGTGGDRTLTATPVADKEGTATITVTVADANEFKASVHFEIKVGHPLPPIPVGIMVDRPVTPVKTETPVVIGDLVSPLEIPGTGTAEEAAKAALAYLQSNPGLMGDPASVSLGPVGSPDLSFDYANLIPAVMGIQEMIYARFQQRANGLEIDGSWLSLSIKRFDGKTVLMSAQNRLFPEAVAAAGAAGEAPSEDYCRDRLASVLGKEWRSQAENIGPKVKWLKGHWRVVREFALPGI